MATLIETMPVGMVVVDATGTITECNSAASRILEMDLARMQQAFNASGSQLRCFREDGSEFPAEENPVLVSLRSGRAISARCWGCA